MKKIIKEEIINPKMLLDLGFTKTDETDEELQHPELTVRQMRLRYFDGAYHFVVDRTNQGIGTMITMDQLIDGFEFVTSGQKLI